ncbi:C-type mannose receptor 2-like [Pecten maximus]|uniref:C-type mannose receptor 2-like n=1 Tax=Pecten maximus TaxID=6579 RepID=UPI0014586EE1|nr:C-type mannose receptor 2-like [Pecten maximus]
MECYLFIKNKVNWTNAKNACADLNSHLVRNENAEIDAFLRDVMDVEDITSIWTGANDLETEGVFVWEDNGVPVSYTDWEENNPNNYHNKQHCVRFKESESWNDLYCYRLYAYACQRTLLPEANSNANTTVSTTATGPTTITPSTDGVINSISEDHINGSGDPVTEKSWDQGDTTIGNTNNTLIDVSEGSAATSPESSTVRSNSSTTEYQGSTATSTGSTDGSNRSTGTQLDRNCFCCNKNNVTHLTNDKKQEIITQLKEELYVAKTNTSASRRKLISVYDSRPSSVALGGLGCTLLVFTLGCIVVPDIINLVRFLVMFAERRKAEPDQTRRTPTNP